jgi:5-methylthioadenosine/S-adenosylhomocysteine deaminase
MFERNAGKWHGAANGRIRAILGPIGPQWCSDELLQAATEVSLTRGVPLHMHALESKLQAVQAQLLYGRPIVEHLDALGVLTRNLTLNHAIWLTDGEIERLGARGCSISHNPLSNLKLGSGVARVRDLKRAGVNVALGTDGTSTSDRADMLRSLGMAALIHRVGDMDYETWVTAEEAFEMATIGSAGSTGLADDIGTIEVGKKADLVLLDREDYGFIPLYRPVQQLAYAVNSDAVRTVLVDGEVVMDERVLTRHYGKACGAILSLLPRRPYAGRRNRCPCLPGACSAAVRLLHRIETYADVRVKRPATCGIFQARPQAASPPAADARVVAGLHLPSPDRRITVASTTFSASRSSRSSLCERGNGESRCHDECL